MANLNDVLQGLVNINSKIANNINNLLDSIGEGFLDIGTLSVTNDNISLHDAVVLINGENISVPELSTSFVGNKICFLEFDVDKNWILTVLDVVDDNFNYDLSVFKNTSRYFGLAQRFGDIFKDIRVSNSVSNDNTIVGALNGALKAIDYDNEMDLEINMDILSRISAVESDIQDLDIKKADKTYVDEVIANADIDIAIDGVVTAVDVGEIEGVEATYVTRAELDDALSGLEVDVEATYVTRAELDDALSGLEVDVDLTEYQKISDNSLTTSNKTIVGAINELFQSANNGKELIASAIGEPLSKEDTFSAMSNDINGLLSTFKTNMMKNGVTIESGDKFKQLIDKIATMVEEGKHKGIKIVPGSTWVLDSKTGIHASSVGSPSSVVYTNNIIPFGTISINIQEQFLTNYPDRWMNTEVYLNDVLYYQTNKLVSNSYNSTTLTSNKTIEMFIFKGDVIKILPKVNTSYNVQQAYDTIKLSCNIEGSEDTTLRDSLANILENKGVDVTEEDDMVSLITKVDSIKSGGLDIITASSLPTSGKENQICIIMENPINQYSLIPNNKPATSTDSIILSYGVGEPNYIYNYENQRIEYNFCKASNNGTCFKSYYWKDSKWNILTHDFISIVENGVTPTPGGTISLLTTESGPCYQFVEAGEDDYLSVPAVNTSSHITSTTEPINFDLYNKIEVDAKTTFGNAKSLYIGFSTAQQRPSGVTSSISTYCTKYTNSQAINSNVKTTYIYDISEFTGTGYLVLYTSTANVGLGIINIRLYP